MFYREDLNTSLSDLHTTLLERTDGADTLRIAPEEVEFHLDATDPTLKFGDKEVPANEHNLDQIGTFVQVPSAFLKRMAKLTSGQTQNLLLSEMFRNSVRKEIAVRVKGVGIGEISEWGSHERITPAAVVEKILPVFEGREAKIARLVDEPHHFSFDAFTSFEAEDFGIGGDFEKDDLTASGVRVGINLKQGLSPEVNPFNFRRFCTNGMETPAIGLKIDSRGQSVDEVLAELEQMARLAFARAEADIAHFYEMREQSVDNPERAIRAIARERGIPNRSTMALLDLAAGEDLPDNPTMFDVVNLVTNFANSPQVRNDGGRLILERAGGAVVGDHASRCNHCQQKVTG